ncbi:MAG: hypothetical protein CMK32_07925 [Porticoccaceae bacterium]|nr:hypothetical protein [Porticoccaceae bacterium]
MDRQEWMLANFYKSKTLRSMRSCHLSGWYLCGLFYSLLEPTDEFDFVSVHRFLYIPYPCWQAFE